MEDAFLTAVAPARTAFDGVNEYYATEKEYIFALAEALRQEYLEIHKAGLLLQVDDAVLANMYDHLVRQSPERYREWAKLVGPENVIAGTDRGFAQVDVIERVPEPVMSAKFEASVQGATLASKELF